jgi:hypothetical protein
MLADVNHDGRQDLVGFGTYGVSTALSNGAGFDPLQLVVGEFGTNRGWSVSKHIRTTADINGDGREDIVAFGDDGVWTALSTESGFAPARFVLADLGYKKGWRVDKHVRLLADVNHDGRKDIVAFGDAYVFLALADGAGGFSAPSAVLSDFVSDRGWDASKHVRTMADVNGDGLMDIVGFGDAGVYTALSTGTGFAEPTFALEDFGYSQSWRVERHVRVLADIDGDKKADIVGFGDAGVYVAKSTGDGFGKVTFALADLGYNQDWRVGTHPRFVADLNNDGYPDLLGLGDSAYLRALGGPSGFGPLTAVLRVPNDGNLRLLGDVNSDAMPDIVDFGASSVVVTRSSDKPPPPPPAAPSGLHVTARTPSSLTLAWTDNSSDESQFIVTYNEVQGATKTTTLAANTSTAILSSLHEYRTYCYAVQAANIFGISAPAKDCATTAHKPPTITEWKATDTTLSVGFGANDKATIQSWIAPSEGNPVKVDSGGSANRVFTNLKPSTEYCVYAIAGANYWGGTNETSSTTATLCMSTLAHETPWVDLVIHEVDLNTYFPEPGDTVDVTWTECIVGTQSPGAYTVKVLLGSETIASLRRPANLPPGCYASEQLSTTSVSFTAGTGKQSVTVVIDADSEVLETNEYNNSTTDEFSSR